MAEQEPTPVVEVNPTPATEPIPVDNAELKAFMGTSYKDNLTIAEVNAFLKGKKYADLNSGNYVAKGKYETLEKKHNDYLESTKDYETIKNENAGYKAKEKKATLEKQAEAANIDGQFIEFALSQIDENAENTDKALKDWAKAHPQFLKAPSFKISTNPNHENGKRANENMNSIINGNLRAAAGKKTI